RRLGAAQPAAQGPRAGGGVTSRALEFDPQPENSCSCRLEGVWRRAWALRRRRGVVERPVHARRHALLPQRLLVFLAEKGILQPIRIAGAPLVPVSRPFVVFFLAGPPRLVLARFVGPVPADQTQRLFAGAEMRMEPVAAIGRGGDHADRLIVLPVNLIALAVLPRRHPDRPRPGIGVALAFDADQHR